LRREVSQELRNLKHEQPIHEDNVEYLTILRTKTCQQNRTDDASTEKRRTLLGLPRLDDARKMAPNSKALFLTASRSKVAVL